MQLVEYKTYYNHDYFSNSLFLIQTSIERYISKLLFNSNLTRIVYSSSEYAFRARREQIAQYNFPEKSYLNLPFCSYYLSTPFKIIEQKLSPLLYTGDIFSDTVSNIRYLPVESTFECVLFLNRFDDAQVAYNILSSVHSIFPSKFIVSGLSYKNRNLHIPILLSIKDVNITIQNVKEKEFLEKNKIIPINFNVNVQTCIFVQKPIVFDEESEPVEPDLVLTKEFILSFASQKFSFSYEDSLYENISTVSGNLPDIPTLNFSIVSNIVDNPLSIVLSWTYDNQKLNEFESNLKILINNFKEYIVPITNNSFVIENVLPSSIYKIDAFYIRKQDNKNFKHSLSVVTSDVSKFNFGILTY